jgi:hypothetical protein
MTARTLIVDTYDLNEIGYVANDDFRDAFSAPTRDWQTDKAHSRIGESIVAPSAEYSKRTLIVNGAIVRDTRTELDASIDELKYRLYKPEVGVRFSNDETREYVARCDQISIDPYSPALVQRAAQVSIRFVVLDPRMRAVSDTVQAFSTATAIALGTSPSRGVIRLTGGTNPIVIYRNYAATEIARMEFTWSGTYIDVDLDNLTIIDNASANQAATLTAGNFFALDPQDGDYVQSQWPTLEVSGGGSAQITYRKMYW